MPRRRSSDLVQHDLNEQRPQIAALFEAEPPFSRTQKKAAIGRHHDIVGSGPLCQLEREPCPGQSSQLIDVSLEQNRRGLVIPCPIAFDEFRGKRIHRCIG